VAGLWRRVPLPALIVFAFLVLQIVAAPAVAMTNDGYRYARTSLQILGDSREVATQRAVRAFCTDVVGEADRERRLSALRFRGRPKPGAVDACVAAWPNGVGPLSPRYEAIFDSRVGYPLFAAPLVALLGISPGLWVTSLLWTALGGWLVVVLLRSAGVPGRFAAAGQVLYYVTPIGLWGGYPLAEGVTLTLTVGALLGAWWMVRRRVWPGLALLAGALVLGFLVKFSSLLLTAAALVAAGAVLLWRDGAARHRGTYLMIAVNVCWLAAASGVAHLLAWPGAGESLQDTFTRRFSRPDVPDPWRRLARLNLNYWTQWVQNQARAPWLVLLLGASAWALFRRHAALAWLVTAVALTGFATFAAHPTVSQEQRLMIPIWLLPVVGVPVLLTMLADRAADRSTEDVGGRR
jgi:hypothetical protein